MFPSPAGSAVTSTSSPNAEANGGQSCQVEVSGLRVTTEAVEHLVDHLPLRSEPEADEIEVGRRVRGSRATPRFSLADAMVRSARLTSAPQWLCLGRPFVWAMR